MLPGTPHGTVTDLDDPRLYHSRELSWLEFNDRVLEEALDESNQPLERLKFIAVYGNNLDEYFMIRVAALKQQVEAEVLRRSNDGLLPHEQLQAIAQRLQPSLDLQMETLREHIFPSLQGAGIRVFRYEEVDKVRRKALKRAFDERVFPVLTPLAVDQGHPFPYISNLSLSLGVEIQETGPDGPQRHFARVKVPQSLPRFVPIEAPPGESHFVLLEDLIAHNLDVLFPGMNVRASYLFRVTRDADLDIQEDEADDLLRAIESELRKRRFGEPVRLEVETSMPPHLRAMLLDALELTSIDLYEVDGMLGVSDLWSLANMDRPELRDKPFTPAIPKRLVGANIFTAIREGDLFLHHPYDSFDPVVQFVRQAAEDPQVLAIKQTLYRTSGASPVVAALIRAAENGKQVSVIIELKSSFDEENNIQWARNLERVGVHVVYGLSGLKVHAKTTLIVRDESDGIRRYVHLGTGNYNEKTARVYTDFSLFSCRPELGQDITHLFNALTGFSKDSRYCKLLVAPWTLRSGILQLIQRETEHALAGRSCGITVKINALSDAEIVRALYRASQAGVPIELIVRGMCELRPGIPGVSETITVRSIVGRFLEHSRVFVFANDGHREVFFGSADWMGRNLDRRVELVVPVLDESVREKICGILDVLLADNTKARFMCPDGTYVCRVHREDEPLVSSQLHFLDEGACGPSE
jgi:polyphosphate kinase